MYYFLILIFSIFYLILSWRRPDWAVMLIIVALPSYQLRFSVLGIPMTVLELMILITFTIWFWQNYKDIFRNLKLRFRNSLKIKNYKLKINNSYPFGVELVLWVFIAWLAMIVAGGTNAALGVWKAYFFEPALLFILIINIFQGKKGISKLMFSLAFLAFWVSLAAIVEKLAGEFIIAGFWPRVTGPYAYPNALGLILGPLVPLLGGYLAYLISNFPRPRIAKRGRQFSNNFQ